MQKPLNSKTTKVELHAAKFNKLMKQNVHEQTLEISMQDDY